VEGSEVKPRRREEGDEATHQRRGGEGEGGALLRGKLVAAVVEATESGLGHRPPRSVPAQPLEALPVVAMHRSVRVKCVHRLKANTCSGRSRTVVPEHAERPFRAKANTDSGACRTRNG
jgi:hypothetical protein